MFGWNGGIFFGIVRCRFAVRQKLYYNYTVGANLVKVSPMVKMLLRNKEPSVTKNQRFSVTPSSYNIVVSLAFGFVILLIVPVLIVRCICHWQRSQTHPSKEGNQNKLSALRKKLLHSLLS